MMQSIRPGPVRSIQRSALILAVLLGSLVWAPPAVAQDSPAHSATPYLQVDHWAHSLVRRLQASGRLSPQVGAVSGLQRAALLRQLRRAGEGVEEFAGESGLFAAEGWLCLELQALCSREDVSGGATVRLAGSSAAVRALSSSGAVLTAVGRPADLSSPPLPVEGVQTLAGRLDLNVNGAVVAARLDASGSGEGVRVQEQYGLFGSGGIGLWLGRRAFRLGPGDATIVLGGGLPLDGGGFTTDPFHLPWLFEVLGPAQLHSGIFQLDSVAPFRAPALWTMRGTLQPHPRLLLGANRAAMVSVEESDGLTRVRRVFEVLIGKHSVQNSLDNQVASVDIWFRPPVGDVPLSLYLEWGFEDSAGAWKDVPGIIGGAYLAHVPLIPELGLGAEVATFAERCCGNPWWYRHFNFDGGWTTQRRPLGHPLGGHGRELKIYGDVLVPWGILARGRFYHRERRTENLYAPLREGASIGFELDVDVRRWSRVRTSVHAGYETGADWEEHSLALTLSYSF